MKHRLSSNLVKVVVLLYSFLFWNLWTLILKPIFLSFVSWLREVHIWMVHFSLYGFWLTFGSLLPSPQSTRFMFGFQWKLIMIKIRGWKQCFNSIFSQIWFVPKFSISSFLFMFFYCFYCIVFYLFFLFYLCFYSHPSLHLFAPSTFFFHHFIITKDAVEVSFRTVYLYCLKKKNLSASLEVFLLIWMSGLKPGQRKVLFTCFKRNDKREVKVAQLAGSVAELSAYHHGEVCDLPSILLPWLRWEWFEQKCNARAMFLFWD